jgi:hypothetical protein
LWEPLIFQQNIYRRKIPQQCYRSRFPPSFKFWIKVITKLPNSEQSYKGKVQTHNYIKEKLEHTNYEAARIITGATKLTSIRILLQECEWETLEQRRNKHKIFGTGFIVLFKNIFMELTETLLLIFAGSSFQSRTLKVKSYYYNKLYEIVHELD